jgi:hypothetical protein
MKHTLYLITYDRGLHPVTNKCMPYHWLYFVQTGANNEAIGIAHQLRGMPGGFYYPGPEDMNPLEPSSIAPKEQLEVGELDDSNLVETNQIFKEIWIDTSESSGWNCQNWSLDGFDRLKDGGFTHEYLTQEAVRYWLKEGT